MARSTRRNNRSRKITRNRKNLSMTRPKRGGKKITFRRRASKKYRTRRFKKRGGMDKGSGDPTRSPEYLKAQAQAQARLDGYYYRKIKDTFNDERLTKEQKIAKLLHIKGEISSLKEEVLTSVKGAENLAAVNRIFEDYIGENGRIVEHLSSIEADAKHHAAAVRELGDTTALIRTGDEQDHPIRGSLVRKIKK